MSEKQPTANSGGKQRERAEVVRKSGGSPQQPARTKSQKQPRVVQQINKASTTAAMAGQAKVAPQVAAAAQKITNNKSHSTSPAKKSGNNAAVVATTTSANASANAKKVIAKQAAAVSQTMTSQSGPGKSSKQAKVTAIMSSPKATTTTPASQLKTGNSAAKPQAQNTVLVHQKQQLTTPKAAQGGGPAAGGTALAPSSGGHQSSNKPEPTSSSKKEERSSEYDPDEALYKRFVTGIYIDRVTTVPLSSANAAAHQGSQRQQVHHSNLVQKTTKIPPTSREPHQQQQQKQQQQPQMSGSGPSHAVSKPSTSGGYPPHHQSQMTMTAAEPSSAAKPHQSHAVGQPPSQQYQPYHNSHHQSQSLNQQHIQSQHPQMQSQQPTPFDPVTHSRQQLHGSNNGGFYTADDNQQHAQGGAELELLLGRDAQNSIRMNQNPANINSNNNDPSGSIQGQGAEQAAQQNPAQQMSHHNAALGRIASNRGGDVVSSAHGGRNATNNHHNRHERSRNNNVGGGGNHSDRYSMQYGGLDGLSFDALFGSHYDSEKDEDYSIKEDLIQNTKTYQNDFKPFKHNVSKAEIAYLKSQQKYDSLLFPGREHDLDFLQNPAEHHYDLGGNDDDVGGDEGSLLEPAESQFFEDVVLGASQRKGTRSQLGGAAAGGLYHNHHAHNYNDHGQKQNFQSQYYGATSGEHPNKRRKFAVDDAILKSEGGGATTLHHQASSSPQHQHMMRMTRQQRMHLVSQQNHNNQQQQQSNTVARQKDGNQLAQNSSNMNILSSNQSQQNLGQRQSNGSSLPGGSLLNRHQQEMAEAGYGRTPNKSQSRNTGAAVRPVQTKSIECQVSPGLLNGEDDEDEDGQQLNDAMQLDGEHSPGRQGVIGKRRQDKATDNQQKKRRRRKSKKQKDAEAAAAALEKAEQQQQLAAAAMALQQQRMQQDQMAFELYKQQGQMMGAASQGFSPYVLSQQRAAMMQSGMYPSMGPAGYQTQASNFYPMGPQQMYGMMPPGFNPMQHQAAFGAGPWSTGAGGPQSSIYHHQPGSSQPLHHGSSTVDQMQAQSKADSVQGASSVAQPNQAQPASGTSSKRKKSQQAKLQKQQNQQNNGTSSLLHSQMLFGTNIASTRFYSGQQAGADFNIMDHYGFMLGPHQAHAAYQQHQQLQAAANLPAESGNYNKRNSKTGSKSRSNPRSVNNQGAQSNKQLEQQHYLQQQQQFEFEQQQQMGMTELGPYQEERFRSKLRKEFYPFLNYQLKELIQQIDMYIQLLYQVLLFDEATNGNKTAAASATGPAGAGGGKPGTASATIEQLMMGAGSSSGGNPASQNPANSLANGKKSATMTQLNHAFNNLQQQKTPSQSLSQTKLLTESQKLLQSGSTRLQDTAAQNLDHENSSSQQQPSVQQQHAADLLPGNQEEILEKKKAYCLLYQFINKRDQILRNLDLPVYEVPWLRVPQTKTDHPHNINEDHGADHFQGTARVELDEDLSSAAPAHSKLRKAFKTQPQVTYLQAPLLEYAPFVISQIKASWQEQERNSYKDSLAQELNLGTKSVGKVGDSRVRRYTYKECFDTMKPLINRYLLPPSMQPKQTPYPMGSIASQPTVQTAAAGANGEAANGGKVPTSVSNNNRRKFSRMDDNMMIMGLQEFGQKNMEQIRVHWLPRKTVNEIKHRYKNLTCQRVHDNMVKSWKQKQSQPLTEREFYLLCQGVKWFGESTNRWALIAKTFLPGRTVKFIQVEFSSIVTDFEKSNRFGKMLLLDVPDHKLLTLANEIVEPKPGTVPPSAKLKGERVDLIEKEEEAKKEDAEVAAVDQTMEIVRKKVQMFEEVDIDRISEFIAATSEEKSIDDHQTEEHNNMADAAELDANDLSLREEDNESALGKLLHVGDRPNRASLDARMAAVAAVNSGIAAHEFGNDNGSGGLASFLHDNLLLSDVNQNKVGAGANAAGIVAEGAANAHLNQNSQQSVGDFLKKSIESVSSNVIGFNNVNSLMPQTKLP